MADFGSAKDLTLSQQQQEHQGSSSKHSFVGTAEYCSPELLSDKDVSFKSDIWAIGCVLYQLLCLAPPFKGANEYQTFQKIIHLEYSFPDQIQTSYRASLAAADGVGGSIDLPSNSSGGSSDKLDEILSSTAKDLISSILQLEPEQRPDFNTIKKHPMFTSTISSSSAPHSNNIIDYWSSLHLQSPPNFPFKTTANNNGSLEKLSVDSDIAFQFGDGLRLQVVDDQKSHTQQFYEDDDDGETEEENTPMYLTPQPSHLNPRDIPVAGTFTATTSSTHNANPVLGLSGNNLIVSSPSQERFVFATKSYHSIGNNINNASLTGRSSPLTVQAMGHPLPLPIPVSKILDAQLLSPYANLLFPREILIREGPVAKKRRVPLLLGGGTRKRTLILTDTPRLLLLEYERPVIKSEIPWGVIYEDPNEFSESNRTSSASGGGAISFSSSSSYSSSSPPSPISPNAASNGAILNSNINGSNSCGGFRLHPLYIKAPISVEYKNPNQFCVRTPTKDYNLDDLRGNARAWVDAIQQMIDKVNDGSLFKRQWKMI